MSWVELCHINALLIMTTGKVHLVSGTRWMLSLSLKSDPSSPPRTFIPIEVFDLQTGCLIGTVDSKYRWCEFKYMPDWQASVAISSTEMVVCLQFYQAYVLFISLSGAHTPEK